VQSEGGIGGWTRLEPMLMKRSRWARPNTPLGGLGNTQRAKDTELRLILHFPYYGAFQNGGTSAVELRQRCLVVTSAVPQGQYSSIGGRPMPEIPVTSPLGYLGVVLLLFGFFLVLGGARIIRIEKVTVTSGPKTWGFGFVLIVLGTVFLLPDIFAFLPPHPAPTHTPTTSAFVPTATSFPPTATSMPPTDTKISEPTDSPTTPTSTNIPVPTNVTAAITYPQDDTAVDQSVYVRGEISGLTPGQRAFLCVRSVAFGRTYPQGEIIPDPAGQWLVESIYADIGYRYETFVVATNNPKSAEMLANEHFREVGMSILPEDTFAIGVPIVVERQ
jgi:hypothetical protein